MKKICELISSNNEEVELLLRLSDVVVKKTTSGDDYASMIGFDGVDKIEAKIWNFTDDLKDTLVSGEVYKVVARTKQYQNRTQLNILGIEKVVDDGQIDLSIFYEAAKLTGDELAKLINEYFLKIDNKILKTIETVFDQAKPTLMVILAFEKWNHGGQSR